MKIKQAVILAGGRGKRLMPLTKKIPKPMVSINKKPFLDYLLKKLFDQGISQIIILTGYKSTVIEKKYYKNNKIIILKSKNIFKTSLRISTAYNLLDKKFLLLYGDNYCDFNIKKYLQRSYESKALVIATIFKNTNGTGEYGYENNVQYTSNNIIKLYDQSRKSEKLNGINIGFYIVNKSIINKKDKDNISFEDKYLKKYISKNKVFANPISKQYYYITNKESLELFTKYVKAKKKN